MHFYVCLLSNLLHYYFKTKNIILIWKKHLNFDGIYKTFMTFFLFHCLLHFYKLEKLIKKQPKKPLELNDKNLGLFHSGSSSKPHAIRYNLSR